MKLSAVTAESAWDAVCVFVKNDGRFKSATGIVYESRVSGNRIFYKGGKGKREEDILKDDFLVAFSAIPSGMDVNATSVKGVVPDNIYSKRTSFIGLLHSSGLLSV